MVSLSFSNHWEKLLQLPVGLQWEASSHGDSIAILFLRGTLMANGIGTDCSILIQKMNLFLCIAKLFQVIRCKVGPEWWQQSCLPASRLIRQVIEAVRTGFWAEDRTVRLSELSVHVCGISSSSTGSFLLSSYKTLFLSWKKIYKIRHETSIKEITP